MATIYITKYALSQGITEREADIDKEGNAMCLEEKYRYDRFVYHTHFSTSKEHAIEVANAMKKNKIASLRKQIAKLEKTIF